MDADSKYQLKTFIAPIADTNYYNEKQKIIRVLKDGEQFDCKYLGNFVHPHPNDHLALVVTCEEFIQKTQSVTEERKNFLPGIINKVGDLTDIVFGFVFPISINQEVSGTNASCGGAAFAIENTNMFDPDKISIALSPPLNVDYTNNDKKIDKKDLSNGVFINKDGTVLIKSGPSSITMGEEGIYFGGDIHWASADHNREWMRDNTLAKFIPLTLVTIPMSMPEIPAIEKFAKLANGANKVISVCTKAAKITDLFT
jgi:hypothetical protein